MKSIELKSGTEEQRKFLIKHIHAMNELFPENRENTITAWTTSLNNSPYSSIVDVPYSLHAPSYKLINHVNEVIDIGLKLFDYSKSNWGVEVDLQDLLMILILHDVDKPLLFTTKDGLLSESDLAKIIPHGVLGSYILESIGFPEKITYSVATHSINSPIRGSSSEDLILHYSDFFSADHAILSEGGKAFFQKVHS